MEKYVIIGAEPFKKYTGTTTYTHLKIVGKTDNYEEMQKIVDEEFDNNCGLIAVLNTETGELE